jgi:hypothetical protein
MGNCTSSADKINAYNSGNHSGYVFLYGGDKQIDGMCLTSYEYNKYLEMSNDCKLEYVKGYYSGMAMKLGMR